MHALGDWIATLLGTASIPAIVAALLWRYRAKLFALLEKLIAERADAVLMNTEMGKRIVAIDEKLTKLTE